MYRRKGLVRCANPDCTEQGNIFKQKTYRHIYCCRKCFITCYTKKNKEKNNPLFICKNCGETIQLKFDPIDNPKRWSNFKCPNCGQKNNFSHNDYSEIEKIKDSL